MSPDTLPDPKTGKQMPVEDRWTEHDPVACVGCGRDVENAKMVTIQADGQPWRWAGLDCPSCGLTWARVG
jgi:hypothetical protein